MKRPSLFFLALTLFLVACAPQATATPAAISELPAAEAFATLTPDIPTPDTSVTITDALGREVKLPAAPKHIVIAGKALFLIADAA